MRALGLGDVHLVETGFLLTADWNPTSPRGEAFWRADPTFAQYTGGWGRDGDGGFVAEEDGRVVGAVWWRLFRADDAGYGFVDERTPELGIAVWPGERGRGIGRLLLRAAVTEHPRISLSVEDGNPARALYEAEGFVAVGRSGDGTIMLHD
ncbi:MAG: GNAT family N-acetyltransferase [Pseudolysinimonas sp.]|jgi:GNAT superfamily N-acetyltransferase|uniref:GNAT family N-acetyltransferase n=1 Tax=Pseudolysinimonas sp. TaxID=2680009 RepID=UPI003C730761